MTREGFSAGTTVNRKLQTRLPDAPIKITRGFGASWQDHPCAKQQSDIGSDASRSSEASGVIDRRKKAKSRDWTDARCCHEPSHLGIIAGQPHHFTVEVRKLP